MDILATEMDTGKKIVIENQLEDTNHDHLGKTITDAAGKMQILLSGLSGKPGKNTDLQLNG